MWSGGVYEERREPGTGELQASGLLGASLSLHADVSSWGGSGRGGELSGALLNLHDDVAARNSSEP